MDIVIIIVFDYFNNLISEIAVGGASFKPQLVLKITSPDDKLIKEFKENQKTSLDFKKISTIQTVPKPLNLKIFNNFRFSVNIF